MTKPIRGPSGDMSVLLDILYSFGIILYLPFMLVRGKWHKGFRDRFGILPLELTGRLASGKNLWIHAVSVGEVVAMDGLIRSLQVKYPDHRLILSVSTKTGYALATRNYQEDALVLWAPLDFSWVVKRFVKAIRPVIYIAAETELWPNLFRALSDRKVPIIIVNGRISDAAFPRYRLFRLFLKGTLQRVNLFCMQSPGDAERIAQLGADRAKVRAVGNVKFDMSPEGSAIKRGEPGFKEGQLVLVGGSTHPGEEDILLNIFRKLRKTYPALRLVLAPRHPERAAEIAVLACNKGLNPINFSSNKTIFGPDDVLVIDKIGHLLEFYAVATVVFVGKSLTVKGGHNIIEPAVLEKAILIGPYMQNFRDIAQAFLAGHAVLQVKDALELEKGVALLLGNEQFRRELGRRALETVRNNRGATERTLELVAQELP